MIFTEYYNKRQNRNIGKKTGFCLLYVLEISTIYIVKIYSKKSFNFLERLG